jgi:hypothetical protein
MYNRGEMNFVEWIFSSNLSGEEKRTRSKKRVKLS